MSPIRTDSHHKQHTQPFYSSPTSPECVLLLLFLASCSPVLAALLLFRLLVCLCFILLTRLILILLIPFRKSEKQEKSED